MTHVGSVGPVSGLIFATHGIAAKSAASVYLGTLFVEPRRHVPGLDDLDDEEAARFGVVTTHLARALREATEAERIYSMVLGHHVSHLHLWMFPRYPGTPQEYWGARVFEWPAAPRGGAPEIEVLCDRIREQLAKASAAD